MINRKLALLFGLVILASACTPRQAYPPPSPYPSPNPQPPTQPAPTQPPVSEPTRPLEPQRPPPPRTAGQISGPAVMALMSRAGNRVESGDLDSAAATLERALDLEPRNPFIYQQLSAVRLEQGQASQSETLARKSNSLAGDNPYIKADNWRLIAQARSIQGDSVGTSSAKSRADYFSGRAREQDNARR